MVKGHRLKTIQDCETCNGEPPEVPFDLPNMSGFKCGICSEILGWKKK